MRTNHGFVESMVQRNLRSQPAKMEAALRKLDDAIKESDPTVIEKLAKNAKLLQIKFQGRADHTENGEIWFESPIEAPTPN